MLHYDKKRLGKILSAGRRKKSLSQKEVADRMGYSTAQFISNLERGYSVIPLNLLARLSKLYGLNSQELVELIMKGQERHLRQKLK